MSSKAASCCISDGGGDTRRGISHILKSGCLFFPCCLWGVGFFLSCKLSSRPCSLPSVRESPSSGESPAQTAQGCQQSAADSPPALLIPALIMPRRWQPPARRASAQCACAQGPQHLHYQPIAYITVNWGHPHVHAGFHRDFKKSSIGEKSIPV